MIIIENIKTGWHQISLNKGKTFLTMLGIIIGISSVILMMTIGQSIKNFLISQIESFGTNSLYIYVNNFNRSQNGEKQIELQASDAEIIKDSELAKNIVAITPQINFPCKLTYNNQEFDATIAGGNVDMKITHNFEVISGNFFTEEDYVNKANVGLLYDESLNDIFGDENPVGKTVEMNNKKITIIGIIKKQSSIEPAMGAQMLMPISTFFDLFTDGDTEVYTLVAKVDNKDNIPLMQEVIKYLLKNKYNIPDSDNDTISIQSMSQFLDIFNNVLLGIQLFLSLIAAISLIVGGVGIMNIMLMTVKERTKEIGLRKAVGAKNQNILLQFLVEAAFLTLLGGIIGIIIGVAFSALIVFIVTLVKPDWNFTLSISWLGVILSCSVSILTGIIFGLYPAIKASKLHPIEALRYE